MLILLSLTNHSYFFGMHKNHVPSPRPARQSPSIVSLRAQKQVIWLRIKASESLQQERALKLAHFLVRQQAKDCLLLGCTAAKKCKTQFVCLQDERELLLDYKQAKRERVAFENELRLHRR